MPTDSELYLEAFRTRCADVGGPGRERVDAPGIHVLMPGDGNRLGRGLVVDDSACDALAAVLPALDEGLLTVLDTAPAARALIDAFGGWRADGATAMACRAPADIPRHELPAALTLRQVRRRESEPPGGVALHDAAAAAARAVGDAALTAEGLASFLRDLPGEVRLFAAVDTGGAVRATTGFLLYGAFTTVVFVNTDHAWRGQGIGTAMTAIALHAACELGARQACLDASGLGLPIYRRLGFETVGEVTRFTRGRSF